MTETATLAGDAAGERAELGVFRLRRSLEPSIGPARLARTVREAKLGDTEALGRLYACYADNVFSYVRSILRDDHAAEDVTQLVFTKLLAKIGSYEQRSVPFAAWLLRIARNCAIDYLRSHRDICCEETPTVEHADDGGAADRREALGEALDQLTETQRDVVVMRHVIGLSPGEIATRIGKSEGAVHTLHHRARRALRRELVERGSAPATAASY